MKSLIKKEIKEALAEIKGFNNENIFINHKKSGVYPFLSVFFEEEEAKTYTNAPRSTIRTLNFSIQSEQHGDKIEKIDDYFDVLAEAVEGKMFEYRERSNLIKDLNFVGSRPEYSVEASKPSAVMLMGFSVSYIKDDFTEANYDELESLFMEVNNE